MRHIITQIVMATGSTESTGSHLSSPLELKESWGWKGSTDSIVKAEDWLAYQYSLVGVQRKVASMLRLISCLHYEQWNIMTHLEHGH